jgi:hypothetical protein
MASCIVWVLDLKSGFAAGAATAALVAAVDVLVLDVVGAYADDDLVAPVLELYAE